MKRSHNFTGETADRTVRAIVNVRRGGVGHNDLQLIATDEDIYSKRLHNGNEVAKFAEDYHYSSRSKGVGQTYQVPTDYRLKWAGESGIKVKRSSTGHLKDM